MDEGWILVLGLFVIFKIPFDNNFIANLLNGLLSNFLILIIAIFVIDSLTKSIEIKKLKDINKRNASFVSLRVNIFVMKILEYLKVFKEKDTNPETLHEKNKNFTFDYIWQELAQISKEKDIDQILFESTFKENDKKQYIVKLTELLKEEAKSISDALKDVYPHPAPDVISTVDELASQSGALYAMSLMADVHEEVNKRIPNGSKKMDKETADVLLKFIMLSVKKEGALSIVLSKLSELSSRAKNNDLFIN